VANLSLPEATNFENYTVSNLVAEITGSLPADHFSHDGVPLVLGFLFICFRHSKPPLEESNIAYHSFKRSAKARITIKASSAGLGFFEKPKWNECRNPKRF